MPGRVHRDHTYTKHGVDQGVESLSAFIVVLYSIRSLCPCTKLRMLDGSETLGGSLAPR
jgi:hypothetical protein